MVLALIQKSDKELRDEAKFKGFMPQKCGYCGHFSLVRNGPCLRCTVCGETTGCS